MTSFAPTSRAWRIQWRAALATTRPTVAVRTRNPGATAKRPWFVTRRRHFVLAQKQHRIDCPIQKGQAQPVRQMTFVAFGLLAFAIALAGCSAEGAGLSETRGSVQELKPEKPCERNWVKSHASQFVRAVDSGKRPALEANLVAEPAFRVYSEGLDYRRDPKRFFASKRREEVIRHLLRRHDRGDRVRPRRMVVGSHDRSFGLCSVAFVIERSIAGGPWRRFIGKGALDDQTGDAAVWNVGRPSHLPVASPNA